MSAIARYYHLKGYNVGGYDKTPSELTAELQAEGICVHYEDRPDLIPEDKEETLVIYTPAIPAELKELCKAREEGYRLLKRSRVLGEIASTQRCIAVAGTHGKTTTSTLIAHILTESGEGCSAFLGGISRNYGTNLLVSENDVLVAEADEFDRSFHQLFPELAVITAMDADHLDIYGDLEHYQEAFKIFASQVSSNIVLKKGLDIGKVNARIWTYHVSDSAADFHAENIELLEDGHLKFDLVSPLGNIEGIIPGALGRLNVENSIAAAAACQIHGVPAEAIRSAIGSYLGAKRRLEVHFNHGGVTYIDDYAHHPEELHSALVSIREIFPSRKVTAIFQPHLYTRTRDFAPEFAAALSLADKVILLDIYPAREEPIPGVSSEIIFQDITSKEKVLLRKEELMQALENEDVDVLVSFGAGNIDRYIEPIRNLLEKRCLRNS